MPQTSLHRLLSQLPSFSRLAYVDLNLENEPAPAPATGSWLQGIAREANERQQTVTAKCTRAAPRASACHRQSTARVVPSAGRAPVPKFGIPGPASEPPALPTGRPAGPCQSAPAGVEGQIGHGVLFVFTCLRGSAAMRRHSWNVPRERGSPSLSAVPFPVVLQSFMPVLATTILSSQIKKVALAPKPLHEEPPRWARRAFNAGIDGERACRSDGLRGLSQSFGRQHCGTWHRAHAQPAAPPPGWRRF